MSRFTPKNIPEITIIFNVTDPRQKLTFHQPGYPPEVEIINIKINGDYVSECLYDILIDRCEEEWVKEILDRILSSI